MTVLPDGVTAEQVNPQPPVFPRCDNCKMPYVLRRALSFATGEYKWAWMRDCAKPRSTCKNAGHEIVDADDNVLGAT